MCILLVLVIQDELHVFIDNFQACEAWKKEAEEANKKAKLAHEECQQAIKQRDEVMFVTLYLLAFFSSLS